MTSLLLATVALHSVFAISSIEGQVVGPDNQPVAQAQVFLEPGLEGILSDTVTSETGHFAFPEVGPGPAGIFAVAPGYGFAGQTVNVAVADVVPPITIVLRGASTIQGKVSGPKGVPVAGARITRIAIKGAHKVGIPLYKLRQYGYPEPASDADGHFLIPSVPEGSTVDLKVGHPSYAQEGVIDVPAGAASLQISLYTGVLVEGIVVGRGNQIPVGQANVLVQNAQPPNDTATATSNLQGLFSLRLKPGVYLYQAQGAGMRSSGWERLIISGERPVEQLRLAMAGTGRIRGNVRDAISGNPVHGVRVSLTTNGTRAAIERTGPSGDFQFTAGEGENIIHLDSTPGYFPPDTQHVKVAILEGNDVELPGMWLKPLPAYQITIVDEEQHPVPGALVSVLRPRQFGWHVADAQGMVNIRVQAVSEDGILLGRAEHPTQNKIALFKLESTQTGAGTVQLFEAGTIEGTVVGPRGKSLEGASVGAFFPGESAADAILLWQTFSDGDGHFRWESVVPGVPQRCAARTAELASGESTTINLTPGEQKSVGEILVDAGKSGPSQLGETVPWYTWDIRCGTLPDREVCAQRPALLVYVSPEDAPAYRESLTQFQTILARPDLMIVLVVNGDPDCTDGTLPVLAGTRPNSAATLLVDRNGKAVFESTGTPPIQLLRNL